MDALDILGSLLAGGTRGGSGSGGGGSLGGKILGELLKGAAGGKSRPAPQPSPQPTRPGPKPSTHSGDIESEARSLEDLLGVATGNRSGGSPREPSPSSYRPAPEPPRYQPQPPTPAPAPSRSAPQSQSMTTNDEAIILIRALINAAKADGRIDTAEQQAILNQVPNDPQTINFLKHEFSKPLDVRDFAWSVPLGMEVKVYTMSLAGMQLDSNAEAQYLQELAHGLRLDPDLCQQIQARYGVQGVF